MSTGILTESLSLAEEYVLENILRETFESQVYDGDEIEVDDMEQCDCLPLFVNFDVACKPTGRWRLVGSKMKWNHKVVMNRLAGLYRFEAKHV